MVAVVGPEDPRTPEARALVERHLAFAHDHTPPDHVHALDLEGLAARDIDCFGARDDGALLAIGALRMLDSTHAEIKSMHTDAAARGRGIGRLMLAHLLDTARSRGVARVSLETGTIEAFAPARHLYTSAGFVECPPFGSYTANPDSTCMTLRLDAASPTF